MYEQRPPRMIARLRGHTPSGKEMNADFVGPFETFDPTVDEALAKKTVWQGYSEFAMESFKNAVEEHKKEDPEGNLHSLEFGRVYFAKHNNKDSYVGFVFVISAEEDVSDELLMDPRGIHSFANFAFEADQHWPPLETYPLPYMPEDADSRPDDTLNDRLDRKWNMRLLPDQAGTWPSDGVIQCAELAFSNEQDPDKREAAVTVLLLKGEPRFGEVRTMFMTDNKFNGKKNHFFTGGDGACSTAS